MPDFYLMPEVEGKVFVQDVTRDGEHLRGWIFGRFLERMENESRPFEVLRGNYEEMFRQAIGEVRKILVAGGMNDIEETE
jgi:HTH-type transcriptional regulator, transcriptional repressor of NAD biosynthesis genes